MASPELKAFSHQIRDQLFNHILPFWYGPAMDREQGGWMAWLGNDLKPDRSQPKGLIVHARILWTFSAVHRRQPGPVFREMADRALNYLTNRFWDQQHGGAFWRLNDAGNPLEDIKKTYGQAFCIYALAEYYQTFRTESELQRAKNLFELIEAHAHDPKHSGYFEVCSRDWRTVLDSALSEKDLNEKKSMNSHLHVLEAYTNLHRVWPDPRVNLRLRELIILFEQRILDSRTFHLHHFFDERWHVRSDTYTFGHDIEASWLLCEAAEVLGDAEILARIRKLAVRMSDTVLNEAVDRDGGLSYEGKAGQIIDAGKECWPQAEAVIGFLNAFQLSGDSRFLEAALRIWKYIDTHLVDRVHGEWFWRINEDGKPDPTLPKVSEWKGPYHGSRMCMEVLHRLKHSH
ncbi:MAG TPA: AGE family epimerase/isomerase [Candidatus Paceibacterota bacterium]|nr:AGE family epimerase/isomerase [Candidatus Paceibacterota bacterium]